MSSLDPTLRREEHRRRPITRRQWYAIKIIKKNLSIKYTGPDTIWAATEFISRYYENAKRMQESGSYNGTNRDIARHVLKKAL